MTRPAATAQLSTHDVRLARAASRSRALWEPGTAASHPALTMFGLTIDNCALEQATAGLIAAARDGRRTRVVFANAHVVNEMSWQPAYRSIVASADTVFADGSGLALAARIAGTPLADNVNGTDLFPLLAAMAGEAGTGIFLLGGAPGIADAAAQKIVDLGLEGAVVGTHHGHFLRSTDDGASVIDAINASGARIVLVGLGVPLQDQWIASNAHRLNAPVVAGVGGLFDYFAGRVSRAPHWLRTIGMEWCWRLALEPRRLAKRYLIGNVVFMALALREGLRVRRARLLLPRPTSA